MGLSIRMKRVERVKFLLSDDQTRVMIKSGSSGDYINANYVNVSFAIITF